MRLSDLFTKTSKNVPADETAKNAQLLIKAGFIYKDAAGVYALLPLGFKVIENIKHIVREEMNKLDANELLMTSLQRKDLWESTDRWDDEKVDVWFKSKLKNDTEVGFGWSHEEQITDMMKNFVASYKDLPANVYQFQTKLRNETRAKSGIMRTREFIMKDLYSYSHSEEEHDAFYARVTESYLNIFKTVGLGDVTFLTFASGGAFTQFSHEFQTITDAGEDTIYLHRAKKVAINQEVLTDEVLKDVGLKRDELEEVKAAEVGNIFGFGTHKSKQLGLYYADEQGNKTPVVLGSYGIGITRLMGVIVEHFADEKGLVWPENVAPAKVYLARLDNSEEVVAAADELYDKLMKNNIETLYDDRDMRPGEKFADADLFGIPYRVVVSAKTVEKNKYEVKKRQQSDTQLLDIDAILELLATKKSDLV